MSFKNGVATSISDISNYLQRVPQALAEVSDIVFRSTTNIRADIARVDEKVLSTQQQLSELLIKFNAFREVYTNDFPTLIIDLLSALDQFADLKDQLNDNLALKLSNLLNDIQGKLDALDFLDPRMDQVLARLYNIIQLLKDSCCYKEKQSEWLVTIRLTFSSDSRFEGYYNTGLTREFNKQMGGISPPFSIEATDFYDYSNSDPDYQGLITGVTVFDTNGVAVLTRGFSDESAPITAYEIISQEEIIISEEDCDLAVLIRELFEDLNFKLDAEQELTFNAPLTLEKYEGAWTNHQEQISLVSKNDALIKTYTELVKIKQDFYNFKQLFNFYQYPIEVDESRQYNTLTDLIKNSGGSGADLSNIERILGIEFDNENNIKPLGTVPKSLLNIASQKANVTINNYSELLIWIVKQLDALIGEFPIEIKIKDADLTEEGDQTVTLKIGNLAEGISELFGFAFQGASIGDASLQILLRLIPEIARIRQLGLITQDYVIANREFLGYKENEVKREIESNFTLIKKNPKNIAKLLETEKHKYKSIELAEKESLFDYLMRFQYIASLLQKTLIKSPDEFQEFVNKQGDEANLDDWNEFLTKINDPTSFFNLDEKPSRVRDVEGEGE